MTKFVIILAIVVFILIYILFHVAVIIQLKTVVIMCLVCLGIGVVIGYFLKK